MIRIRHTPVSAAIVSALSLATAAAGASGADGGSRVNIGVDSLTLRQQVGQLILLRFAGTSPPDYVLRALREGRAAGVILFRDNVVQPRQLGTLTARLREAGGRPLVAVDQEGGHVRILDWAPPQASAPEQARAGTVRSDAEQAARVLRSTGLNVTLAPVGDVPSVPGAALGARSFSSSAAVVSVAVAEAVRGWRAGGVASTAKHFPGLGAAPVNTDQTPVTISRTRTQLERTDFAPFRAAIRAGVALVMVGHARYPALDPHRIASQSRAIVDDLLRERLDFRGVVVTDSMEAAASLATGSITAVSERAVRAGVDLVLLTGRGSYTPVYRHLLAVAERWESFRARVRESAARVLALKERGAEPPR